MTKSWMYYFHQVNKFRVHFLSGAIIDLGLKARSWQGWQIPILTDANHTSSNIMRIKTEEISNFVSQGGIAVITGFQGVSMDNRITTLGRGGSDLSAVVIAKFFRADSCEIYTDVDGIFTTDPSINNNAKKLTKYHTKKCLKWPLWEQKLCNQMQSKLRWLTIFQFM